MHFERLDTKLYIAIDFVLFILFNAGVIIWCLISKDLAYIIWKINSCLALLAIIMSILELMKKEENNER